MMMSHHFLPSCPQIGVKLNDVTSFPAKIAYKVISSSLQTYLRAYEQLAHEWKFLLIFFIHVPELQIRNLLSLSPPEPLTQIQNFFTELFLWIPSTKIAQMVMLRWTKWLPKLQIRNTFKGHFLLNHWFKFKIISQNCTSSCLLPILHKWFRSAEQKSSKSSR